MKIREIISHLELMAPPAYQENYDNSGIIAGDQELECTGAMVTLDCTEEVVREAAIRNCNLIISHHPLIFRAVSNITPENATGRTLIAAIRAGISVYAIHTNLDNIKNGVNMTIGDKLGLINRRILSPRQDLPAAGSGIIGDLQNAVSEDDLLDILKTSFHVPVVRHSTLTGRPVVRVAVCGGAGSFLIPNALNEGAGFFISADIKYHEFFGGENKMVIADIGHFESEQFTVDLLYQVILEKFPNFAVLKSGTVTNPVNYYI